MVVGALLRPLAIVGGGTFVVHRLSGRLDGSPTGGFPSALVDAFRPDRSIGEAIESSAVLAGWTAMAGIVVGLTVAALLRTRIGRAADGPGAVLLLAIVLAVAVPGLGWLVVDPGGATWLARDGSATGPQPLAATSLGPWFASVALVPGVVGFVDRERSDRARWPRWPAGVPTTIFTIALAVTEILGATGGVFDRFGREVAAGRADDLLELALPVVLVAAGLALVAELGQPILRRRRPDGVIEVSDELSAIRRVTTAAVLAVVVTAVIVALGLVIGPSDPVAVTGPRLGGPWLGTDADGHSLAPLVARALAVNLAGAAVPALAATVVGAGLAVFLRVPGPLWKAFAAAAIDLFSWPAVLVVPLAAATVASSGRPAFDPLVIQFTGLLLVPAATRLLLPPAVRRIDRLARLVATFVVLTWLAIGVHLLVGLLVADPASGDADLGGLLARGLAEAGRSPWPAAAPTLAALLGAVTLLWVLAAVTGTYRLAPLPAAAGVGPGDPAGGHRGRILEDDESTGEAVEAVAPGVHLLDDDRPLVDADPSPRIELLNHEPALEAPLWSDSGDATVPHDGSDVPAGPISALGHEAMEPLDDEVLEPIDEEMTAPVDHEVMEPVDEEMMAQLDEQVAATTGDGAGGIDDQDANDAAEPGPSEGADVRLDVTVASAIDAPTPDPAPDPESGDDPFDEATRTIELRPSDLRRAGVRPPDDDTP